MKSHRPIIRMSGFAVVLAVSHNRVVLSLDETLPTATDHVAQRQVQVTYSLFKAITLSNKLQVRSTSLVVSSHDGR